MTDTKINSFNEFYPMYLREHSNPVCRALHYIGSFLVLVVLYIALTTSEYKLLWLLPVIGYGFAWVGHFFIEKNRPATFTYPFYSFIGDWVMLKDFLTGQISNKLKDAGVSL
ncbi:DUF962 domain-containing protein [Psychrosphaera aquimarina]|jgi:hypothetical protein|uniref:DUF962 domain-containing protein n=1 Tax=Psychrosphaera aquimarina TaxID=2044854 RepID=A0ABU3QVG6_9GAMM|nr:DUF962 domain-containing protein [Psychrosphaera aquimarina]MDU0111451.1 DUF962 domain-containing protein [Psychrosphaera aquimarina]